MCVTITGGVGKAREAGGVGGRLFASGRRRVMCREGCVCAPLNSPHAGRRVVSCARAYPWAVVARGGRAARATRGVEPDVFFRRRMCFHSLRFLKKRKKKGGQSARAPPLQRQGATRLCTRTRAAPPGRFRSNFAFLKSGVRRSEKKVFLSPPKCRAARRAWRLWWTVSAWWWREGNRARERENAHTPTFLFFGSPSTSFHPTTSRRHRHLQRRPRPRRHAARLRPGHQPGAGRLRGARVFRDGRN